MADLAFNGTVTLSTNVRDIDASLAWFKDALGFEEAFRVPGWAEVTTPAPGVTVGLTETEAPGDGAGGATPVFGVADIDAARAALEAKGVRFEGETVELPGMVKLATFKDPDGNRYMFAQSLMDGSG